MATTFTATSSATAVHVATTPRRGALSARISSLPRANAPPSGTPLLAPCLSTQRRRRSCAIRASADGEDASPTSTTTEETSAKPTPSKASSVKGSSKGVNLFDPAATLSRAITRRFGIVGGLGFVAILASTEGYEIVKTLLERDQDVVDGEVVELPSGLSYRDVKIGGGPSPKSGDFVGINVVVSEGEELLLDTRLTRPVAFTFGKPTFGVVCPGLVEGVATMRRGGSRELLIPSALAFGAQGAALPNGSVVKPNTDLKMVVTLVDVTGGYL